VKYIFIRISFLTCFATDVVLRIVHAMIVKNCEINMPHSRRTSGKVVTAA